MNPTAILVTIAVLGLTTNLSLLAWVLKELYAIRNLVTNASGSLSHLEWRVAQLESHNT
jgi:hypothetical protein